ncbi:DUF3093 domain-containing protein [Microbacterium elymi]|uniref:DUF3093 domain-containing protein n=1 Tax=Microbacterium elymi TaxID=2909587 RepID=A0ABY5NJM0_9MICO|nr:MULTISPECIES: DUF3093 domain-containing protein [Microbacterium]UUT35368.1 DUF3093 domain-containing protein [Microbacterium elymi]
MQKTSAGITHAAGTTYRERLTPSLWVIVSAAVAAPMATMVFVPFDQTLALVIGILVAVAIIAALLTAAPVVEVRDGLLRAGRARIPVEMLGEVTWFTGPEARELRGPGLPRGAWHLIRGGIDGAIRVGVIDPDDPTPSWVVSSRTPDRLAAAVRRAQARAADRG